MKEGRLLNAVKFHTTSFSETPTTLPLSTSPDGAYPFMEEPVSEPLTIIIPVRRRMSKDTCPPLQVDFILKPDRYVTVFTDSRYPSKNIYFDRRSLRKLQDVGERFTTWKKDVHSDLSTRTYVFKLKEKVILQHHHSRLSSPKEEHTIRLSVPQFLRLVNKLSLIIALFDGSNDLLYIGCTT